MRYFPRSDLARRLSDELEGKALLSDARNGLFLAAPRRTGKSTFLQEDLKPELERRGITVVYVDFWGDVRRDPGDLLAGALARAFEAHRGVVPRLAAKSGISRLSVKGLEFDIGRIGQPRGISIPDALRELQQVVKGPIALILDEAQQSLSTEAGLAAMKALKSARDQMNSPEVVQLTLVLSGSDRDKLMRLVASRSAPFYGSRITPMPLLGVDFVQHLAKLIECDYPHLAPLDSQRLHKAFRRFGHRPQIFMEALKDATSPFSGEKHRGAIEQRVVAQANEYESARQREMESEYLGLKPLEQAVLWRMLEQADRFAPYEVSARSFYARAIGRKEVSAQRVQKALEGLRNREPPLVWRAANGTYAVEETGMREWYQLCIERQQWPPGTA